MNKLKDTSKISHALHIGIIFLISTLVWLFLDYQFGDDYSRSSHLLRSVFVFITIVPLIFFFWKYIDKKPLRKLNIITVKKALYNLCIGSLSWLLPAFVITLLLMLTNKISIETTAPIGDIFTTLIFLIILVFIYEAFTEELIFRGYIYTKLLNFFKPSTVVIIQAILFTLWGHFNGGENSIERAILFFTFALLVGTFRKVTGNIWTGVGFHLAFQVIAQLTGSVGGVFEVENLELLMITAFVVVPFLASNYYVEKYHFKAKH